jgi:hypothetical protein
MFFFPFYQNKTFSFVPFFQPKISFAKNVVKFSEPLEVSKAFKTKKVFLFGKQLTK